MPLKQETYALLAPLSYHGGSKTTFSEVPALGNRARRERIRYYGFVDLEVVAGLVGRLKDVPLTAVHEELAAIGAETGLILKRKTN